MAQAALARGFERVFLQVDAANPPALALYRRAGFATHWNVQLLAAVNRPAGRHGRGRGHGGIASRVAPGAR
jgi:hypothetical protein